MSYQLICSDIDGTLLDANRALSAATREQVARLKDHVPFVLISSRMPASMRLLQAELGITDHPLICYNGGLVIENGNPTPHYLASHPIPIEVLAHLAGMNLQTPVNLSLYCFEDWFVEAHDYWTNREINNTRVQPVVRPLQDSLAAFQASQTSPHKIMCMGDEAGIDQIEAELDARFGDTVHRYRSKPTYLEIASREISKASALEYLLKETYGFGMESVIAFGDHFNDIEMLKSVGMGVAVANAKPEVIAISNGITEANIEDGVAKGLMKHFPV